MRASAVARPSVIRIPPNTVNLSAALRERTMRASSEVVADHRGHGGVGVGNRYRASRRLIQISCCGGIGAQEPVIAEKINQGKAAVDVFQACCGIEPWKGGSGGLYGADSEKGLHGIVVRPTRADMGAKNKLPGERQRRGGAEIHHDPFVLRAKIFYGGGIQIDRPQLVGGKASEPNRGINIAQTPQPVVAV